MIEAMIYYTQNQAAKMLAVSRGTIINWRKAGRFPHIDRNGHYRIPQCCLENIKDSSHPKGYDGKEVSPDDIVVKTTDLKNETAYINAKVANDVAQGVRDRPEVLARREKALDKQQQEQEALVATVRRYVVEFINAYNSDKRNRLGDEALEAFLQLDKCTKDIEVDLNTSLYDDKEDVVIKG